MSTPKGNRTSVALRHQQIDMLLRNCSVSELCHGVELAAAGVIY